MKAKLKLLRSLPFATIFFPPFEICKEGSIISFKGKLYKVLEMVFPVQEFTENPTPLGNDDDFFIILTVCEIPNI